MDNQPVIILTQNLPSFR